MISHSGRAGLALYDWKSGKELVANLGCPPHPPPYSQVRGFGALNRNRIVFATTAVRLPSGRPALCIVSLDSPQEVLVCPDCPEPSIGVSVDSITVCEDGESFVVSLSYLREDGGTTLEVWRDNERQLVLQTGISQSLFGIQVASRDDRIVVDPGHLPFVFVFQ